MMESSLPGAEVSQGEEEARRKGPAEEACLFTQSLKMKLDLVMTQGCC